MVGGGCIGPSPDNFEVRAISGTCKGEMGTQVLQNNHLSQLIMRNVISPIERDTVGFYNIGNRT